MLFSCWTLIYLHISFVQGAWLELPSPDKVMDNLIHNNNLYPMINVLLWFVKFDNKYIIINTTPLVAWSGWSFSSSATTLAVKCNRRRPGLLVLFRCLRMLHNPRYACEQSQPFKGSTRARGLLACEEIQHFWSFERKTIGNDHS